MITPERSVFDSPAVPEATEDSARYTETAKAIVAIVAQRVRENCTPSAEAYAAGGDRLIAAVADWIESPPEWVDAPWRNHTPAPSAVPEAPGPKIGGTVEQHAERADKWLDRTQQRTGQLAEALDILAHIVSQANVNPVFDLDGDDASVIRRYDMPVGSIHKAIPFLQRFGIVVDQYGAIHKGPLAPITADEFLPAPVPEATEDHTAREFVPASLNRSRPNQESGVICSDCGWMIRSTLPGYSADDADAQHLAYHAPSAVPVTERPDLDPELIEAARFWPPGMGEGATFHALADALESWVAYTRTLEARIEKALAERLDHGAQGNGYAQLVERVRSVLRGVCPECHARADAHHRACSRRILRGEDE